MVKGSSNLMLPRFQEPVLVSLGYVKVPRIEEEFDSRNLLPSTALDPKRLIIELEAKGTKNNCFYSLINSLSATMNHIRGTIKRIV